MGVAVEDAPAGWRRTFASLRHRNYRLWFGGQLVSLFGTWMQSAALGYLVFELTHSSSYLGYVAFAAGAPSWLFMLWAGTLADRLDRRRLLLATQVAMLVLSAALAGLTFGGWVRPWHLLLFAFGLGAANAFDAPVRQAIVPDLVGRRDVTNAIALNSLMFNSATTLGPAVGGGIYAAIGPGWCFSINAVSFLAVLGALLRMRLAPLPAATRSGTALGELRDGLRYVVHRRTLLVLVLFALVVTVFGFSFVNLLPAWAVRVLHGDAATHGWLQSSRGLGALVCALVVASLGRFRFRGLLLTAGSLALPLALLAFAASRHPLASYAALCGYGAALVLVFSLANALLQTLSDDAFRGRVMAIYSFAFFGFLPLGALAAGAAADAVGEPLTIAVGAGVVLLASVVILLVYPPLRRTA
ncbi:MAG: MFS transporter [Deltaproteobacteria bacterium]|nr:MFS transporter [Deltaproteobacteria bacterium]